jgi:signal transduction histidine kinase
MEELQHNSQAIVTQLNDTIWALNREGISFTAISDRFKIFLQKIQPSYQHMNISVQENIEQDTLFSPANALHLFRIMQEAVNNAARHSQCCNLTINMECHFNWKTTITDDGIGMLSESGHREGNGLRNMKRRAEEAGWKIAWENNPPHGTSVTIFSKPPGPTIN